MDTKLIIFLTTLNFLLCIRCFEDGTLENMIQQWRQRNYMKDILRRLDDRIDELGHEYKKSKRPCVLNLPGSGCDSMDILGMAKDQGHWADQMGPGKKRRERTNDEERSNIQNHALRKRTCSFNLPGTNCENSEIIGAAKDAMHWNSEVSPGRKRNIPIFQNYDEE